MDNKSPLVQINGLTKRSGWYSTLNIMKTHKEECKHIPNRGISGNLLLGVESENRMFMVKRGN